MPDNTLHDNVKALKNLINLKETTALGYAANMNDDDKNKVCITLNKNSLNNEENNSTIRYYFKANISSNYNTICFDKFGRVFNNSIDDEDSNLIHDDINITLTYRNKTKYIIIDPITGYVSESN